MFLLTWCVESLEWAEYVEEDGLGGEPLDGGCLAGLAPVVVIWGPAGMMLICWVAFWLSGFLAEWLSGRVASG